jgi:hypothetical protein
MQFLLAVEARMISVRLTMLEVIEPQCQALT